MVEMNVFVGYIGNAGFRHSSPDTTAGPLSYKLLGENRFNYLHSADALSESVDGFAIT